MLNKALLLVINLPSGNARIGCMILGLILAATVSAFGQGMSYTVGPGDDLYISVFGHQDMSGQMTVGPDGTIMLPQPIGTVYVNHMTADEITTLLIEKLEEYVKQPVVSVSIRSFQGFVIHMLGQVKSPSFYQVPENTSLQEVITKAGGFTELADPRSIILYHRNDDKVEKRIIDFRQFLEHNDMENNPVLEMDDVVVVPGISMGERVSQLVTVMGEVVKPGSYDLDAPLSLLDVLALADGALRTADLRNIVIYNRAKEGDDAYRQVNIDVTSSEAVDSAITVPTIFPGETVIVPTIGLLEEHTFPVNVAGQVVKQGSYPVVEDMRLMDAIFLAGGFAEEASIDNIVLIHEEQDGSIISSLSMKDYLTNGNMDANPVLHERDTIIVPMIETARSISPVQMAFSASISVSVIGAVTKPGIYQIPAESGLLGALAQAGGPSSNADLERTMLVRNEKSETEERLLIDLEEVVTEGNLKLLPILSSGDIVLIPEQREKVKWWRSTMTVVRDMSVILGMIYTFVRIQN